MGNVAMNSQANDKAQKSTSIWVRFGGTFGISLAYLLVGIYPLFVALMNPIPNESQLTRITATVIHAGMNHPNLEIQLPDQSIRDVDFPNSLSLSGIKVPRFYGLEKKQIALLPGNVVEIGEEQIRWSVTARFRIWELHSARVNLSFQEAINYYQRDCKFNWIDGIFHVICISLTVFIYQFEKRKKS